MITAFSLQWVAVNQKDIRTIIGSMHHCCTACLLADGSHNSNFKSRVKVCAQWRILKPPGSLLATDRSKAVVLV